MIWPSVHALVLDQMAAAHRGPNRNSRILLRLQERKGELVDRASAAALVFRLAREERDAWINWPARVAALMAAERLRLACRSGAQLIPILATRYGWARPGQHVSGQIYSIHFERGQPCQKKRSIRRNRKLN